MKGFSVEENSSVYGAKMKVIGVGGGGGNMINHMIREGFVYDKVELIVANTDAQALDKSEAKTRIQLGETKVKGLGAGGKPEVGKESAEESYDEIKNQLDYADIVFIGSGFGGGTGTGAAPVVARAAKENKSLTIGIVTTPFAFEGLKRMKQAKAGIEELKKECDSIIVIPNEKLLSLVNPKEAGIKDCFKLVDNVLMRAVNGMVSVIMNSGKSDVNVDFADVKTVMSHRGIAIMGVGVSEGDEAVNEALKDALQSPLLDDISIDGAMGVLVHFRINTKCSLLEISKAMTMVQAAASDEADIIFGTTTDESIENNRVEVTLIATGFESPKAGEKDDGGKEEPHDFRKDFIKKMRAASGSDFTSDDYDEMDREPAYTRNRMD
ncbi:cell division protein FtsZ [Campylobacter hominis]|uniref:cell division protein FtsZ n=1 Tax=Campylobacter hominis TaxID=76517 RepID=UPI00248C7293|nr:cell division protein FtsZ [Campylobacter hominis]